MQANPELLFPSRTYRLPDMICLFSDTMKASEEKYEYLGKMKMQF